ncbi:MAG TPA: biotin/lipoyl-containing protein [Symbiobacteriaceae bacterium]|nr:biotin/lipoyl-containing protein [Symbiobacteriaceae bacterium]
MARKFRITIGGVTYNVEVEEIGGSAAPAYSPAPVAAPAAPVARPAAPAPAPVAAAPAPAPAPAPLSPNGGAPAVAGGEGVKAPLPGMIAAVKVEVGQTVTAGQVVAILEAMKMENDITAHTSGVVKEIRVGKGSSVAAGDVLIVIG